MGIVKLRGVIAWVGEEFERRGGTLRREIKVFETHKADDTFTPIGGLNPCPTHTHTHTRGLNRSCPPPPLPSPPPHTHTHIRLESFSNAHTASAAGRERAQWLSSSALWH